MERINIPRAQKGQPFFPGTWKMVTRDGKPAASLKCPRCGEAGTLDHEIDTAGNVEPSVWCGDSKDGVIIDASGRTQSIQGGNCSFHARIRLLDWEPLNR